jgi:hypothetical protein
MKLRITCPFYLNARNFVPGLIVDLPAKQAQIILRKRAAVLAESMLFDIFVIDINGILVVQFPLFLPFFTDHFDQGLLKGS